jgi:uncharacterized protein
MRLKVYLALFLLFGFVASVILVGEVLSHPARSQIGEIPANFSAREVKISTVADQYLSGWQLRGQPNFGAVLLLHGVRADRRAMLSRAKFLNQLGYAVLLIDLPAHGQSSGNRITYGLNEGEGVKYAMKYLARDLPNEKIAVIGVSLGAASLVLSKEGAMAKAVVLESMFPSIQQAVEDRLELHLGSLGSKLAPLLMWQLPLRLGISPDQLKPVSEINSLGSPVLIASGSIDKHTKLKETMQIFNAAASPKELWIVEDAAHVDLHEFAGKAYEAKITSFLDKYLH